MAAGTIASIPNLSKEEELELGRRIQAKFQAEKRIESGEDSPGLFTIIRRGERAAEKLIRANTRLVHSIAHKFKYRMPNSPEHEDLFAAGLQGLWVAATKYDPSQNNKFSTVATHWIRQAIVRSVNNTHRLVRLPENRVEDYIKILDFLATEEDYDTSSSEEEQNELYTRISETTGIREHLVRSIMNAGGNHTSLNRKVSDDDDSKELLDIMGEVNNAESAENSMIRTMLSTIISNATGTLSEVETAVLSATNKISLTDTTNILTQKATREKYGLTHTDYQKIQEGALSKLRQEITNQGIREEDLY